MDLASRWMQQVAQSKATVVNFVDWDDEVIARVAVPKHLKGEQRLEFLNAFVRDNLIHPDLRHGKLHSLHRRDTYRGKYAYDPAHKDEPAYIRKDGEKYPLTNKLDYKFVTGKQMPQADGTITIEEDANDPYPYLRGFINVLNTADSPWTTFGGTGELAKFRHKFTDGREAGYGVGGQRNYGLGYMSYPDGTIILCDGWGDLAAKGGGDSTHTKTSDEHAVPLDDATPMLLSSYDDTTVATDDEDVTVAEAPSSFAMRATEDDEMVEIADDELENLYALRDRWNAIQHYTDEFIVEMGCSVDADYEWQQEQAYRNAIEMAVRRAPTERLLEAMRYIISEAALGYWTVQWHVPAYLAEQVLAAERRRGAAQTQTEEV